MSLSVFGKSRMEIDSVVTAGSLSFQLPGWEHNLENVVSVEGGWFVSVSCET